VTSCSLEEKNYFLRFGFGVLGPCDHDWGMFCGYFDDFIIRSDEPILWLKVLLDSRL